MADPLTPKTIRDLVESGKLKLTGEGEADGHLHEDVAAALTSMANFVEGYDRDFDRGPQGYDRDFDRTTGRP
jgi:hypothetical protein